MIIRYYSRMKFRGELSVALKKQGTGLRNLDDGMTQVSSGFSNMYQGT